MKIAILIQNDNHIDKSIVLAYAYTVQNDVIISRGEELLSIRNIKYLASWLLQKDIDILYINEEQNRDEIRCYLKKIDVTVRSLDDLKENPLLNKFLLEENTNRKE